MDQMHDELLKLDGQLLGAAGRKLQLVSSSEDDEWETVGPKNKSAVTRTQSFVPSELSAIFGGQLRSVVKAKGSCDLLYWCDKFFNFVFFNFVAPLFPSFGLSFPCMF